MSVDLEAMEERLKVMKSKKLFIQPGMRISHEEILVLSEMIKTYGKQYFDNCIAPFGSNKKDKLNLSVEILCSKCGEKSHMTMGRGAFIEYVSTTLEVCAECENKINLKKKEDEKKFVENYQKEKIENTSEYIKNYLNKENSWKREISQRKRWELITNQYYIQSMIFEYVSKMPYYDYLLTPQWKAIADKKRKLSGYKCQMCNGSGVLSVHHKSYEHKGLEMYNMNDLTVLCDSCHKKFHDITED